MHTHKSSLEGSLYCGTGEMASFSFPVGVERGRRSSSSSDTEKRRREPNIRQNSTYVCRKDKEITVDLFFFFWLWSISLPLKGAAAVATRIFPGVYKRHS